MYSVTEKGCVGIKLQLTITYGSNVTEKQCVRNLSYTQTTHIQLKEMHSAEKLVKEF